MSSEPRIRSLTLKDSDRILEIDGKLEGFVLADIRPWEFGNRAHVGWIIALGVTPGAQGKGIGKKLGERVLEQFQRLGVTRIQTLVGPKTADLEAYFTALGFTQSPDKVLVRDLR